MHVREINMNMVIFFFKEIYFHLYTYKVVMRCMASLDGEIDKEQKNF